ncbi:MAG: phytoene synthase [Pelagibacteraceae bacterium TMED216]|nr:MAG: phytoene synthase [Pelagibacteraceae bacterium TMED216]|tara:strand:+ start:558 stop:1403 length:846 start_codon:yes stop_codon:yes gene_type:complete
MNNLLKKHAKSFYWASFFLSKSTIEKSISLYNFCRTLDDIADNQSNLKEKKDNFLKFKKEFLSKNSKNPIINEMWSIIKNENISEKIVLDLFDGIETDLNEEVTIKSKKDLLIYAYRVAGTVGLMMSKILKVKNKEAMRGALDLGIAMQLTNIARDVIEDKNNNRQYINFTFQSIKKTIEESQVFYHKSFNSISKIPLRSRFSVIVARRVYRKIGDHILKKKNIEDYTKAGKIYVPMIGKINETFFSIFDFLKLLFVKNFTYDRHHDHNLLAQEVNFSERI